MSTTRYINAVTRCVRCQRHTLNGFLSLAGLALTTQPHRLHPELHRPFQRRYLSNSNKPVASNSDIYIQQSTRTDHRQPTPLDSATSSHEYAETFSEAEMEAQDREAPDTTTPSEIPWYLQQADIDISPTLSLADREAPDTTTPSEIPWYLQEADIDISPTLSLADRQRLPEVPSNAPKNFSTILERLSTDIGLDCIQLIDLRPLEPPPALGAGVMMLIGTARSEKHLHVSADRFARWLRATYKLSVNADGLLGRNEVKLQMKRRAKRAKLLGSVGAVQREGEEEENKSGWICVDAGVIEQSVTEERSLDDTGIIGFGGQTDGVKLVVQIMTDDKRREIDLETLWGRALERHWGRIAARDAGDVIENDEESEGGETKEEQDKISRNLSQQA